jgi:hypothetical protein
MGRRVGLVALVLPVVGCVIPGGHHGRVVPHSPEAVQRFTRKAEALVGTPSAPSLSELTYSMSAAVEALPQVKDGEQLEQRLSKLAEEMNERPNEAETLARSSLDVALEAVERARPPIPRQDKDRAVDGARRAITKAKAGEPTTVVAAYREVARAMQLLTNGTGEAARGGELSQLVARFTVDEPDDAQRTGAQAIAAMAEALKGLAWPAEGAEHSAKELEARAEKLAKASSLEYAGQLKAALSLSLRALDRAALPAAERRLLDEARPAVEAIRDDRPLALQHAAAAVALRLVTEAMR